MPIIISFLCFVTLVTGLVMGLGVTEEDRKILEKVDSLIKTCQADLPRDEFCHIIAVEDKKK